MLKNMKKLPLLIFACGLLVFSCTKRFECKCDYQQRSFELDDVGDTIEIKTPTQYLSYISFTSKKLSNEECDERGRSLAMDTLKVEVNCSVSKYRP